MRKLFLFMMVSLDGYFEGKDHDLSWHNVDKEFNEFAIRQLDEVDMLVFGHRTYELMANFWPAEQALQADPETARRMNALPKLVFSHEQLVADWGHTETSTDVVTRITALKQQPGKAIAVLGSSNLCVTLLREGLLDELRLMVNPVVLGEGTALFAGLGKRHNFSLTGSQAFTSGNVLVRYTNAADSVAS